jgi:hypothetical protein
MASATLSGAKTMSEGGEEASPPGEMHSPADAGEDEARRPNRAITLERISSARRRVYVPLRRRAGRFLTALEESGNVTLARETAGLGKERVYRLRRNDPEFAARWRAALAAFRERAERWDGIDLEALERDGLTVKRGRGGEMQIYAAHPLAWTKRREDCFFACFAETGNVAAAARAAGFSGKAAWARARACPAFAERLAAARAEATERLEFQLIEQGTNLLSGEGGARPDPQLAMWLLKREDQRRAGSLKRGAGWRRPRTIDEARDSILTKLAAFDRKQARERTEVGWTQTGDGHWIPPGYGRLP